MYKILNKKVNILITSAGRRVSLVKAFLTELHLRIPGARVFTGEMNPEWSAACRISDGFFVLPRITDSEYIVELLNLCLRENIGLVVPTIDTELEILSTNLDFFASSGISVAVSDQSLVSRCRDKRKTNILFSESEIDFPKEIDKYHPTFPLFVKPYDGSLSKDILLVKNSTDWHESLLENEKLMFMEYLSPDEYQEFTVDAYFDKNSILKCLVPRRRIEVRGGEISKGRVEKGALYGVLKNKFKTIPGARSCLTMQFFEHRKTGRIVGIEINPRFGGGFPLSYAAGASYPGFLIDEYILGKEIDFYEDWLDNRVMLRYDAEVIFDAKDFS
jgi:carbamoyl-phosphate synthase large subunit